jgi:uncharacterized protein (DUF305 family)
MKIILPFTAALLLWAVPGAARAHEDCGGADLTAAASSGAEAAYLAENDAAMAKMMNDMTVKPTGDVDRDFVAMMVPHHQGAIDMALAVLRYGRNEQLRRLAQEIIVTQQQEIAAMRLAAGEPLPPSIAAPTQNSPSTGTENEMHRSRRPVAVDSGR